MFTCELVYEEEPQSIIFECKFGGCKLSSALGEFSNLNKHLSIHKETRNWYDSYRSKDEDKIGILKDSELKIIRLFISSHQSLTLLRNEVFVSAFKTVLPVPDYKTFRYTLLPNSIIKLKQYIEIKLKGAAYVTIIPDIWEKDKEHFLGLAAILTYNSFERLFVVLGIQNILGNSSEDIKKTTESIINEYQFEYSKIKGIF